MLVRLLCWLRQQSWGEFESSWGAPRPHPTPHVVQGCCPKSPAQPPRHDWLPESPVKGGGLSSSPLVPGAMEVQDPMLEASREMSGRTCVIPIEQAPPAALTLPGSQKQAWEQKGRR